MSDEMFAVVGKIDNDFEWRDGALYTWRIMRYTPQTGEQMLAKSTRMFDSAERAREEVEQLLPGVRIVERTIQGGY